MNISTGNWVAFKHFSVKIPFITLQFLCQILSRNEDCISRNISGKNNSQLKESLLISFFLSFFFSFYQNLRDGYQVFVPSACENLRSLGLREPSPQVFFLLARKSLFLGTWDVPLRECRLGQILFAPAANQSGFVRDYSKKRPCAIFGNGGKFFKYFFLSFFLSVFLSLTEWATTTNYPTPTPPTKFLFI